jgi:hypothetical protein
LKKEQEIEKVYSIVRVTTGKGWNRGRDAVGIPVDRVVVRGKDLVEKGGGFRGYPL